jgi:4-hydroxy-tetrahydrodipicolinate synthase
MAHACLEGDFALGAKLQLEYLKLINSLFMTVNPIPVKQTMAYLGKCTSEMRLPLCEMTDKESDKLYNVIDEYRDRLE